MFALELSRVARSTGTTHMGCEPKIQSACVTRTFDKPNDVVDECEPSCNEIRDIDSASERRAERRANDHQLQERAVPQVR